MPLPPWLDITPQSYMQAVEAGDRAGQALAAQAQQADEQQFKNWMLGQQMKQDALQMLVRQREVQAQQQALQDYRMREAAAREMQAQTAAAREGEFERHNQAVEKGLLDYRNARLEQIDTAQEIAADKARAMVERGQGEFFTDPAAPGHVFFRQNTGHVMKVSGPESAPRVSIDATTGAPKTYTGRLDDPRLTAIMGTNAPAAFRPAPPPSPGESLFPNTPSSLGVPGTSSALLPGGLSPMPLLPRKRVKVKGPNGESGTVLEGTELPEGWKLAE